jgi:replication factor A2
VRNITNLTTFITYKLDDGTGELDVKVWPDKDDVPEMDPMDIMDGGGGDQQAAAAAAKKKQVVVNGYAKVVGKIASFNNRRNVTAMFVKPITDMNEFHYHFIEATASHLYFSRGPPGNKQQATGAGAGTAGRGDTTTTRGGKVLPSMSPLARKMYETLANTPQSNEGLHVQHLATEIGVQVNDIIRAAEELKDLGQIYPTVDEQTWAVLDFY